MNESVNPASEEAVRAERYRALSAEGKGSTRRGNFPRALAAYEAALAVASECDDRARIDASELNRSMVLIQMGRAREGEDGLREILLRTGEPRLAFSAAYNLASSLRQQGRYDRAMTYALRAMDRCEHVEDGPGLRAAVLNLMGNILLNQSYLDEALARYEAALALRRRQPDDNRYSIAILEENIGYCQLLKGDSADGIEHIQRALKLAGQIGDRRCRTECLQDLCFGYLRLGRHEQAASFGAQALSEAVDAQFEDIEENCHYMLGELASRTGDMEACDRHFGRLQELHPELPFLRDFLCSVDVTSLITLKR